MKNKTLDYYNHHAQSFISTTVSVNFKAVQDKFIYALNGPEVLDFGCGSGRDTKYFLESGLQVTAVDGSEEMCRYASEFTGIQVQNMLFQDLDAQNLYDGIWACSSILHLPKSELHMVLSKMADALRDDGIIYTSFNFYKFAFEGERNGRYFTDFTIETFTDFIKDLEKIRMETYWISTDVRPGRGEEKWLNVMLRKH